MKRNAIRGLVLGLSLLLAGAASAQEVGTVAGASGGAEIGTGGVWTPAAVGGAIHQGDELRTGPGGQLRVVFQDDSVINLGSDSHAVVDEQVFDPKKSPARSVIQLLQGRVRALVSEYYRENGAEYEIQTATAVAGVRGTEFVVSYDAGAAQTEIVGITGKVEVHSVLDRASHGVYVTAGEVTNVRQGQFPTQPPRLGEDAFHQVIDGLDFIGTGRAGGLTAEHPIVGGVEVPQPDCAPKAGLEVTQGGGTRDASSLLGQPPGVLQALTGDLRIHF